MLSRRYIRIIWWSLALFVSTPALLRAEVTASRDIKIGVLAIRQDSLQRWTPTADYLTKNIPGYSFRIIPLNSKDVSPTVERGEVDFVITNPGHYIELEAFYGATRILTLRNLIEGKPYTVFGAVLFTRADRTDLTDLKDLRGQILHATHEKGFSGWFMGRYEMKKAGLDALKEFKEVKFVGLPLEKIVNAVLTGEADVGIVRTDVLERMEAEGKIDLRDFRVINPQSHPGFPLKISTRLYPEWPIAKVKHTSDELAQNVAVALLRLTPTHPAAKANGYAGWTVPLDYSGVHQVYREMRVGPYADYGKATFADIVSEYGYWMLAALVALLLLSANMAYIWRLNRHLKSSQSKLLIAQGELERARDVAVSANRHKSEFLAMVSHELRTPLQAILGFTELALEELGRSEQESRVAADLRVVFLASQQLHQLVNNVLDFTKIEAGRMDVMYGTFALRPMIEEVVATMRPLAERGKNRLTYSLEGDRTVHSDRAKVRQIVLNLLSNACKFTESGLITVSVVCTATTMTIEVRDTGRGIPKEDQELIFEAFRQASNRDTHPGGAGLGLTITSRLCHLLNGEIRVNSMPGQGSTFTVRLPTEAGQITDTARRTGTTS